jgi:hypothetical protein
MQQSRSNVKNMLTVFFDCQSLGHSKFIPTGKTVHQELYMTILHHLQEAAWKKWLQLWFIHYNNDAMPTVLSIQKFPMRNRMPVFLQPILHPSSLCRRIFPVPKIENQLKRTMTWISRGNARKNATAAKPHFFKIIYRRMGKMKTSFQLLYECRRGLFWRG